MGGINRDHDGRVRAKGQSLGSLTHWVVNAALAFVFPMLAEASGGIPFVFFAVMMVVQFFFALFIMPETKGSVLEDVGKSLAGKG